MNARAKAFCLLLVVAFLVRFPYFFQAVINWDESTLILMGQALLEGRLPYVDLWENKPPLAFLAYSGFIGFFGQSIVAVRIGGLLCVTAAAYVLYLTGRKLCGPRVGWIAAVLSIVFISLTDGGQATLTEVVALPPLLGAMTLLAERPGSPKRMFAAGLCLSLASLVRLNLAYVPLFVGTYWLWRAFRGGWHSRVPELLAFVLGGLLLVGTTWVVYAAEGHGHLWVRSVFLAPLSYSTSRFSALEALVLHLRGGFGIGNIALWGAFLVGVGLLAREWHRTDRGTRRGLTLLAVFLLGTVVSVVQTGAVAEHYLIQIVPFLALPAAVFYARLADLGFPGLSAGFLLLGMGLPTTQIALQYGATAQRAMAGQPLPHGAQYAIAEYLREHNPDERPVYLMTDQIVYWFTGTWPPTRMTVHPANLSKVDLLTVVEGPGATPEAEMKKVLKAEPLFIVKLQEEWYLETAPEAQAVLEAELAAHYQQAAEIRGRGIYRRILEPG